MARMWIGAVTANGVTGTVGFGAAVVTGSHTRTKQNTGNGTITGDHGYQPCLTAGIADADVWDCVVMQGGSRGSG